MSIVADLKPCAFLTVRDRDTAKAFYGGVLGLTLVSEDEFAVVFALNGVKLRISPMPEHRAQPHTVLGWNTDDVPGTVRALTAAGISFERYDFLKQDDLGIWTHGEAMVAWFKDPDGNTLSISSH